MYLLYVCTMYLLYVPMYLLYVLMYMSYQYVTNDELMITLYNVPLVAVQLFSNCTILVA